MKHTVGFTGSVCIGDNAVVVVPNRRTSKVGGSGRRHDMGQSDQAAAPAGSTSRNSLCVRTLLLLCAVRASGTLPMMTLVRMSCCVEILRDEIWYVWPLTTTEIYVHCDTYIFVILSRDEVVAALCSGWWWCCCRCFFGCLPCQSTTKIIRK